MTQVLEVQDQDVEPASIQEIREVCEESAGNPTTRIINIDPSLASDILDHLNTQNRVIRYRHLSNLSFEFQNGNGTLTNDAIAFGEDGTLYNGQHRLAAVVKSGVTVPFFVTYGMPEDSLLAMDTGKSRTLMDTTNFYNPEIAKHRRIGSYARIMRNQGIYIKPKQVCRSEEISYIHRHQHALLEAAKYLEGYRVKGLRNAALGAVLARVVETYYGKPEQKKYELFMQILLTGMIPETKVKISKDPATATALMNMALRLRNHIKDATLNNAVYSEHYRKIERSIKAFLNGEPLKNIVDQVEQGELFPLSDD